MVVTENKNHQLKQALIAAFPYTVPVLAGFSILGFAYGVLMQSKGYGVFFSTLMSMIAFCGSMQFVAITILTTAFNPVQAFLLSLMINARHVFYGIAMLEKYKGLGKIRFFLIYTLCDETFSLESSVTPEENISKNFFYMFISLLHYTYWVVGTFIGGIAGNFITFNTKGLDFVLNALFIVLFLEQMKNKNNYMFGLIGIFSTAISLLIFGPNNLVIPGMIIILSILLLWRGKLCD